MKIVMNLWTTSLGSRITLFCDDQYTIASAFVASMDAHVGVQSYLFVYLFIYSFIYLFIPYTAICFAKAFETVLQLL